MENAKKVFISHASEDKERFVIEFAQKLRENGIDAWLDLWEMKPGDKLVDKIFNQGLKEADAFIVVLSKYSVNKKWVIEELESAVIKRINEDTKLIPVIIDSGTEVPEVLKPTIWCEIEDLNNYDLKLNELINSIYGVYDKSPLGTVPKHINQEINLIGGLTKIDTIVLKTICDKIVEQEHNQVQAKKLIELLGINYNILDNDIHDSLLVMERKNLIKCLKTYHHLISMNVTFYGFEKYAHTFVPNYKEYIINIATYILNNGIGKLKSNIISKKLGINEYLTKHILELLHNNSMINVLTTYNITIINKIYPELRRFIENGY